MVEKDIWQITVETADGAKLHFSSGGSRLAVDGATAVDEPTAEYDAIYDHFEELLNGGKSHVDAAPFQLVADGFMVARRKEVEASQAPRLSLLNHPAGLQGEDSRARLRRSRWDGDLQRGRSASFDKG